MCLQVVPILLMVYLGLCIMAGCLVLASAVSNMCAIVSGYSWRAKLPAPGSLLAACRMTCQTAAHQLSRLYRHQAEEEPAKLPQPQQQQQQQIHVVASSETADVGLQQVVAERDWLAEECQVISMMMSRTSRKLCYSFVEFVLEPLLPCKQMILS